MTLVEGEQGVIVIDPLISAETAAAALGLYRAHRGDRPVTAVIYTHSHVDHFGGVEGVVADEVPILAPAGFLEHAVSENVYAGNAMNRRAVYMYGAVLERGPAGQVGAGLGLTNSTGSIGLLPPTVDITHTGQEETVDGVRISFQLTPGTEAPAEMNFLFPEATELRNGIGAAPIPDIGAGMAAALTVEQLFDSVAIRVNGPKAWSETVTIDWNFTDLGERYRMSLANGVLVHYSRPPLPASRS
jgi:alkyl sulfatase BDS1-like metallo-beta-lactamase superfamily hydrolase